MNLTQSEILVLHQTAQSLISGVLRGDFTIRQAGQAYNEALHNTGEGSFSLGSNLTLIANQTGRQLILDHIMEGEMTSSQYEVCQRIKKLVRSTTAKPNERYRNISLSKAKNPGGFEFYQGLVFFEDVPDICFFTWDLILNQVFYTETESGVVQGRPRLRITVRQTEFGTFNARVTFGYKTNTSSTRWRLLISSVPLTNRSLGICTDPKDFSDKDLWNFDKFP